MCSSYTSSSNIIYYQCILWICSLNRPEILRTRGPLELANPSTVSGEKCLRCYLPNLINNSGSGVLDKVTTRSYEGFSVFIKRTKLNNYRTDCIVPDCYVCNNCPWIYPIFISTFHFVVWYISRSHCSSIVSLIRFSLPVLSIFFAFLFCFCVPFPLLFSSLFFFKFLLLKFANHVTYARFIVHDLNTIIVQCMFSSACNPVQTTNLFGNIDILYLLSHAYSISLSMGRINSKYFFLQNALVPVTEFSHSKYQNK